MTRKTKCTLAKFKILTVTVHKAPFLAFEHFAIPKYVRFVGVIQNENCRKSEKSNIKFKIKSVKQQLI